MVALKARFRMELSEYHYLEDLDISVRGFEVAADGKEHIPFDFDDFRVTCEPAENGCVVTYESGGVRTVRCA